MNFGLSGLKINLEKIEALIYKKDKILLSQEKWCCFICRKEVGIYAHKL